jgi:hypothetical protein
MAGMFAHPTNHKPSAHAHAKGESGKRRSEFQGQAGILQERHLMCSDSQGGRQSQTKSYS